LNRKVPRGEEGVGVGVSFSNESLLIIYASRVLILGFIIILFSLFLLVCVLKATSLFSLLKGISFALIAT